jgi:hypothetical protein
LRRSISKLLHSFANVQINVVSGHKRCLRWRYADLR